jgi:class 3 adenylate cyclase
MTTRAKQGAVLFADICDSVRAYERYGNARGLAIAEHSMEQMIKITEQNGGKLIRPQGDGVKSIFSTGDSAYDAAIKMQLAHRGSPCDIKVTFSYGPLLSSHDDVFGDTVHLAARLLGLARPGEILLPGDTAKHLSKNRRINTQLLDTTHLKGRTDPVNVYTVNQGEQSTETANRTQVIIPSAANQLLPLSRLTLLNSGRKYRSEVPEKPIVLGRSIDCDIVVNSSYASRHHARIEPKRSYFLLTDLSTNGTYVTNQDSSPLYLKRESTQLIGHGVISLGRPPSPSVDDDIHFFHEVTQ